MIGTGFADDGQKRNTQNRNTIKDTNRGRFKKIYPEKYKSFTDEELSQRKKLSEYKGVNDLPISIKWIILALILLATLAAYLLEMF